MPSNKKPKGASQNQMRSLEQTSVTCDRFQVSDIVDAAIATSVLSDLGFVSSEDRSRIIDKGKLRRERQKRRTALQHKGDIQGIKGLYFDGRKDKTLVQEKDEKGFTQQKIILEEHITVLAEPNSQYLSHETPTGGSGKELSLKIFECLQRRNVDATTIVAVGCKPQGKN